LRHPHQSCNNAKQIFNERLYPNTSISELPLSQCKLAATDGYITTFNVTPDVSKFHYYLTSLFGKVKFVSFSNHCHWVLHQFHTGGGRALWPYYHITSSWGDLKAAGVTKHKYSPLPVICWDHTDEDFINCGSPVGHPEFLEAHTSTMPN